MLKNAKAVVVDEVRDWENKSTKENRKGDIIASYNIRGLRGRVKKRKIKELLWQPKNDLYISSIKNTLLVMVCGIVRGDQMIASGLFFLLKEVVEDFSLLGVG
jgi:hypothetical protein